MRVCWLVNDPSKWANTQIQVNGQTLNNDTVWCYPDSKNINTWQTYFPQVPHYKDVKLTKGKHTIRIMSLAGQWRFDCFDITNGGSVGFEDVVKDRTENVIKIYPNPATDFIHISDTPVEYTIYSVSGSIRKSGKDTAVDITDLNAGLYLVRVNGKCARFIKK